MSKSQIKTHHKTVNQCSWETIDCNSGFNYAASHCTVDYRVMSARIHASVSECVGVDSISQQLINNEWDCVHVCTLLVLICILNE